MLVLKPESNRPLGKPRHRWEDIGMDLKRNRVRGCGLDSSGSGQVPLAGSHEHSNEPSVSILVIFTLHQGV
jgi:hypothetical protein